LTWRFATTYCRYGLLWQAIGLRIVFQLLPLVYVYKLIPSKIDKPATGNDGDGDGNTGDGDEQVEGGAGKKKDQ
jgi:hypothetical protein